MNFLDKIKSKHTYYKINFGKQSFVFRNLTIKESKIFIGIMESRSMMPLILYEEIFNLVYVGNSSYLSENTPIGYLITIGQLALKLSSEEKQTDILFKIARVRKKNNLNTVYEHMRSVIFNVFKAYKLSEIEMMTQDEFVELFVVAENVMTKTTPNFKRLDLKALYDSVTEPSKKEEPKEVIHNNIDVNSVASDMSTLENSVGYWEKQEAEEKYRKEREEELKLKMLRELDARHKRG
jgi:hypothetical protein